MRISDLPELGAANFTGEELVPVVKGPTTFRAPLFTIADHAARAAVRNATTGTFVTTAQGYDFITTELAPGSNRFVKTSMAFVVDEANSLAVSRHTGSWLCRRVAPEVYENLHPIIGGGGFEVFARETGNALPMGTLRNQHNSNGEFFYHNGNEVPPAAMVGNKSFRSFELAQRTTLTSVSSGVGLSSHRSRHIFVPDGWDYEFEHFIGEPHSLANLVVGQLDILLTDGATRIFDSVRRGPMWDSAIDLTGTIYAAGDGSNVIKYSGPLGLGIEFSIAPGTAWGGPRHWAKIDAQGRASFDFHNAAYSSAKLPGETISGTLRVRFGWNGD